MLRRFFVEVAVVLSLITACSLGYGQNVNAVVTGTITDAQGAVIPGATVTFKNTAAGTQQTSITSQSGTYRVGDLIPGTYEMTVSLTGFQTVQQPGITLHVQDQLVIDQKLTVGSISENVTVQAGAPELQTQTQTLGQVIESQQVDRIPQNGMNVMNLMSLSAGVVPQGTTTGTAIANQNGGSGTNPAGWDNYQIGGGTAGWNAVFLDGMPLNITNQNWLSLVPTQSSIAEFKVDTNAVSPQYGRFAGGVISYSTKSGGNQFHGSVYEYLRNTALDANTFFGDRTGLPKAVLIQNQYGTTVGGPIKRDKAFFFFSWEGLRRIGKSPQTTLEPTIANLNGNFSSTATTNPIFDPTTGKQFVCNGQLNVICPDRINPTATDALNAGYWTPPNTSGPGYNLASTAAYFAGTDQYIARLDQQISDKQRAFGRYTYWIFSQGGDKSTSQLITPNTNAGRTQQADLGDSYTFTQSLVGDIRLYYDRFYFTVTPPSAPDLSLFGPGYTSIASPYKEYPEFNVVGYTNAGNILQIMGNDVFGISPSVVKTKGKHTLTFGAELREIQWYVINNTYPGGFFSFTGHATENAAVSGSGNSVADFVLGMITPGASTLSNTGGAGNTVSIIQASAVTHYMGYYATDNFRPTEKLNITAGFRWELPGTWTAKENRDTVLQPNTPNPLGTITNPATGQQQALTGILALVGSSQYPSRHEITPNYHLIDPRIGFNYSLRSNLVVRAGFGMSQPSLDSGSFGPQISPVNEAVTTPTGPLNNPFPNGILLPVGHNTSINLPYSQFAQTLAGSSIDSRLPNQKYPTVYQYNLSVQQALSSRGTFELAYAGSHGSHMPLPDFELDQLADKYDSMGSALLAAPSSNPLAGLVGPTSSIASTGGSNNVIGQFLRPYPQFIATLSSSPWIGDYSYNALQANVQERISGGSSLLVAYTWGRLISNYETQNGYLESGKTVGTVQDFTNLSKTSGERAESDFDVRQRLSASYILNVPFGHNQRFLNHLGPAMDRVASGWVVSGITTLQSGYPVSLIDSTGTTLQQLFGAGQARPNYVPGCTKAIGGAAAQRLGEWFNKSCFTAASNFGFGDEPRVDSGIQSQGIVNTDLTASKNTPITERTSLEFRADLFNLFNRVQFAGPNTSFGSAAFGTVTTQLNNQREAQLSLTLHY
jgi:Carboxypeptidase regulatory-like domain